MSPLVSLLSELQHLLSSSVPCVWVTQEARASSSRSSTEHPLLWQSHRSGDAQVSLLALQPLVFSHVSLKISVFCGFKICLRQAKAVPPAATNRKGWDGEGNGVTLLHLSLRYSSNGSGCEPSRTSTPLLQTTWEITF